MMQNVRSPKPSTSTRSEESHSESRSSRSRDSPSKIRLTSNKNELKKQQVTSVLYLRQNHAKFNAPSKRESIFFDECNREILSLTRNSISSDFPNYKTRVVFQRTDVHRRVELHLPIEKKVLSIKFNPTRSILAYHVERNTLEFINIKDKILESGPSSSDRFESFKYLLEDKRYVQSCRAKNSKLIGFLWTGSNELVLITNLSVEYYHIDSNRRRLIHMKSFQSATNWFVYQPQTNGDSLPEDDQDGKKVSSGYSMLIVSTGSLGNSMQPYMFSDGQCLRLQRFDVDGNWNDSDKLELFERSITISEIYGYVRLLVLQHESLNVKSKGAQIVIFTIDPNTGTTSKTHTLDLDTSGRFAINILDNLVIAHDQPSKTSFIFDIAIESTEKSDCPRHYVSLIDSRPIRKLEMSSEGDLPKRYADMYSLNWVFFQPNFIVDAKLGLLSTLQIDLDSMQEVLQDNLLLLSFLARRENSEKIILNKCAQIVNDSYKLAMKEDINRREIHDNRINPLAEVSAAFEILSNLVKPAPKLPCTLGSETSPSGAQESSKDQIVPDQDEFGYRAFIDQEDVEREIFRVLTDTVEDEGNQAHFHFVSSVLLEFIFAVRCRAEKNVDFCIYDQLVKCLVRGKRFFQIIQMIRSEILEDSKQLACLLISMKGQYKPAVQLGLDMFHRLPCGPPPANLTELMQD